MYAGSIMIGSGMDTIRAHSWYGSSATGEQTSFTVTEGDCTPVTMGIIGMDDQGL